MAVVVREVLGENLEDFVGRDISIDPEEEHDRKYFVEKADDYFDLRDYHAALKQNSGDFDAINDIAYKLSPENPKLILNRGAEGALLAAKNQLDSSGEELAKYADKNSLVERLSDEQLDSLVLSLVNTENVRDSFIYETGDFEHDRIAEIVKKQALIIAGKQNDLIKDISRLMKDKKVPAWHKAIFDRYSDDQTYLAELINSYTGVINMLYAKEFTEEKEKEGKKIRVPDGDKLYKFHRDNLKVAEDAVDDEPDEKKKYKIWDKNIKPVYLIASEIFFRSEKKAQKEEDEKDEEKKKKERKARGLKE